MESAWLMFAPDPAEAPDTLVELSVQLKVVPATDEVRTMAVLVPLQMVEAAGVAVTSGTGFTITLIVLVSPHIPGIKYVIVLAPAVEASIGSNKPVVASTQVPHEELQVPPPSTASMVTLPLSWQYGPAGVMVASNCGFTVTVAVVVLTQLLTSVPVMVYVVVAAGLAVTLEPVVALNPVPGDQA